MVYLPATRHLNGVRLLALDGGGVRGVASLIVLKEIMARVQARKGLKHECRPADFFELAAGTSTGGIIGIMLFRLRMTASEAIDQYDAIAKEVFSPRLWGWDMSRWLPNGMASAINNSKTLVQSSRFDDKSLKKAIDRVVEKYGLDEEDRQLKGEAPLLHPNAGRMFVCTTAQNRAETVLLRTYKNNTIHVKSQVNDTMREHSDRVTISLATRATSAAPTFFPEVKWPEGVPDKKQQLTFWDGGLLNNNPIDQLWYARYELVQPDEPAPPVSCVISLGTGYTTPGSSPADSWFSLVGVASSVMGFATNTNAKGKDFSRHMTALNNRAEHAQTRYVRLNPHLGNSEIGLADYTKMDELKALARAYVEDEKNQLWIDKAVAAVCDE
ncbi:FabD/lysophospholipase-like protein [Trichoderma citrinoviride]|uniref:FabD/lysophospholipase-like protein n=1 Tax=Trichoderma citrinoviride TaxID=58853 RepID=A0A2T4BJY5_9HYPO|nr:FabD/lysophospholipase-like protein [Trichoderma citrinoviride]PTB69624.1 FabD/lysophospholipase-like protein [Trichoderma citrinoviride]